MKELLKTAMAETTNDEQPVASPNVMSKTDITNLFSSLLVNKIADAQEKYQILEKVILVYYAILSLILTVAFLKVFDVQFIKPLITDKMGIIALACFVAIQITFELEDNGPKRPIIVNLKAFFYIFDICILVNAKVSASITICVCIFSGIQLFFMFRALCNEEAKLKLMKDNAQITEPEFSLALSSAQISIVIICINAFAILIGVAKGTFNIQIDTDLILSGILGALVMYYIHALMKSKTASLLRKKEKLQELSVLELSFKVLRPVGQAIFKDMKKFKFS